MSCFSDITWWLVHHVCIFYAMFAFMHELRLIQIQLLNEGNKQTESKVMLCVIRTARDHLSRASLPHAATRLLSHLQGASLRQPLIFNSSVSSLDPRRLSGHVLLAKYVFTGTSKFYLHTFPIYSREKLWRCCWVWTEKVKWSRNTWKMNSSHIGVI